MLEVQEKGCGLHQDVSLHSNITSRDHISLTSARKQKKGQGSKSAGDYRLEAERKSAIYESAIKIMYRTLAKTPEWKGLLPLMSDGEPSIHSIFVQLGILGSDDDAKVEGDVYPVDPGLLSMEATEEVVLCEATQNAHNANFDIDGGKSTKESTLYKPQSNLLMLYLCS